MNILPKDTFVLTEKAIKREEFLKRITFLKWDNAEVIGLIFKIILARNLPRFSV